VPEFAPLLRELNERAPLAGHVITIDAGHTVRAHATFICGELAAHYVMTVKGNTPGLFDALDSLGWAAVPVSHQVTEAGHGRKEKRTIQVTDAPDHIRAMLPHARQVFLIERYVTRKVRERKKNSRRYKTAEVKTAVAVFGITSLSAREAAPEHLAAYVRGHWAIENKIHWVTSPAVRTPPGSGPHPGPASWSPCVTSRSGQSARPATPRSPRPSGRSSMTPACSWPSSACQAQYEQQK